MIISHKYKVVFVHIPKTGGTSISTALRPLLGPGDFFEILHAPKHYTARQIRNAFFSTNLEWSSYLSFAIMRNPWERIYSDYCFSKRMAETLGGGCEPGLEGWVQKIRRISQHPFERFVSEEFLGADKSTYQRYCQDDQGCDMLTFVGQFDRLTEDWQQVCNLLRLDARPLPHKNRTQSPRGRSLRHYRGAYTPKLRALVFDRFRYDIERFGYAF